MIFFGTKGQNKTKKHQKWVVLGFWGGFGSRSGVLGGFGSAADPQSPSRGPPGPPGDPRDPTDWKTVAVIGTVGPLGTPPLDPFWVHFGGLEPPFWGGSDPPFRPPKKGSKNPSKSGPKSTNLPLFVGRMPKKCQLLGKSFWLRRQKNTQKWVFGTFFGVEPWNVQPKGGPLVACFLMHFFLWIFAFLEQKFDYPPFLGSEGGSRGGPEGHPREGPPGGSPGGSGSTPRGGRTPPGGSDPPPSPTPFDPPTRGGRTPPLGGSSGLEFSENAF